MTRPELPKDFHIDVTSGKAPSPGSIYRRQKTPWWQGPWLICGGLLIAGILGWVLLRPTPQAAGSTTLNLGKVPPISIQEQTPWTYRCPVQGKGISPESLRYELLDAPHGVVVDPQTGELSWNPTEVQGPGKYPLTLQVSSGTLKEKASFEVTVEEVEQPPEFAALPEVKLMPGETATVSVAAKDPDFPARIVEYTLDASADAAATLDRASGEFQWIIPSDQSPGEYPFSIQASEADGGSSSRAILRVTVLGTPDPLLAGLRDQGATVSLVESETQLPPFSGQGRTLLVNGGRVYVLRYASPIVIQQDADNLQANAGPLLGVKLPEKTPLHAFRTRDEIVLYAGESEPTLSALQSHFGEAFASIPPMPPPSDLPDKSAETAPKTDPDWETLVALHKRDRLATADGYPVLQKLFADRFAREHEAQLQQAWGEDYREMMDWLNERPEVREELFTALDVEHDQIPAALGLFQTLRKEFPNQIEDYAHLAIAVSVVWDAPRHGVVDYAHHARRTHSTMPTELLSATDVFRYFVEAESWMQGRAKFLPWEFLIWIVDDRTPLAERKWAYTNYLKRRAQIGKCYQDVPYDTEMLRTASQVCRLDGQDYVLPNIRKFGGVCAMQADFASRVAKSLGVPAAYVGGESRGGELHAWVMWVELLDVNRNQIRFSLESFGRYRGDKYYVGGLRNPQTGQPMTDREMERQLRVVGMNPKAKRHADFAVHALDLIDQQKPLGVKQGIMDLLTILKLCPGHEPSWRKLASLAGSDEIDREERRMMVRALDLLFKTFTDFPDFTWKVFADITRYETDPRAKIQLYERLLKLYQNAGRPDLACEAALATADLLVDNKQPADAVKMLSSIILRFADEGRYVPQMLDRAEEIHKSQGGNSAELVSFYQTLVPKIPPKRGNDPSPYAIQMYKRAIESFNTHNRPDLANALATKLTALEAGQ